MAKQVLLWIGGDRVLSFNTVAAMLADANANGQDALTRGYNSVGDCGWNLYYYDSGSSATIDGGHTLPGIGGTMSLDSSGVFDGVAGTGRYLAYDCTYDPAKFGADVTGTTDTAKFWKAMVAAMPAAGGKIEPTHGEYLFDAEVAISKPVAINGRGVKLTRNADTDRILLFTSSGEVWVDGLEMDGGATNPSAGSWVNYGRCLDVNPTVTVFRVSNCNIYDGTLSYAVISSAFKTFVYDTRIADGGAGNLRMRGEYNYTNNLLLEKTTSGTEDEFRHLGHGNTQDYQTQTYRHIGLTVHNNTGANTSALLGVWDSGDTGLAHPYLVEIIGAVLDWGDTSAEISSMMKFNAVRHINLEDITHNADSAYDNDVFVNINGTTSVCNITNCVTPGNLYFNTSSTVAEMYTTRCRFGFKTDGSASVILGAAQGPTTDHIVDWTIKDCKWQGCTADFFANTAPADSDQRIRYDNLHVEFNSASVKYFASNVTSPAHYVGTGLRLSNAGASYVLLANTPEDRLLLTRTSGESKRLSFGIRNYTHPDNNTTVGYAASGTSTTTHPIPDAGVDKFPGVNGFLGDIIENCDTANGYNEQGWIHDGTQWIERG